jgi:glycosyltransferase involved in cell wall biosynthesis
MLIDAWARVRPENWKLRIVGPDEAGHRAELERAVREAKLGHVVSFRSAVQGEDKMLEMRRADLFVLPTHSESFGMAVAEAMSYGLPVLTTTAAPWPALETENGGWRVSVNPESIANGLREATSLDPNILHDMGRRGREIIARDYQWSEVAPQFVELYESAARRD